MRLLRVLAVLGLCGACSRTTEPEPPPLQTWAGSIHQTVDGGCHDQAVYTRTVTLAFRQYGDSVRGTGKIVDTTVGPCDTGNVTFPIDAVTGGIGAVSASLTLHVGSGAIAFNGSFVRADSLSVLMSGYLFHDTALIGFVRR